jgi:ubiquinone/menaquinone biosynthesis C-methylase UbiE
VALDDVLSWWARGQAEDGRRERDERALMPGISAAEARSTYDAASSSFDDASLGFWDRYGRRTVARIHLRPGARVLDVCCGSGASALPAARAVGAEGSVIGIDVSERLLGRARRKAAMERLSNVDFRLSDMGELDLPAASFDAVVIVFGIFFAPDMVGQLRALARLVRPGGVLAVTTWGPRIFEPLYTPFLEAVRARRPGKHEYRPWDRLSTEADVTSLMRAASLSCFDVAGEVGRETIEHPEDWWTIVRGTGLRWFIDQLEPGSAEALRADCLRHADAVTSIETNVVFAVAHP